MSAFTDLMHDIVDKLRFYTEQQVKDVHDKVEEVEAEIRSWVQAPGVKSIDDVQNNVPATPDNPQNPDTPPVLEDAPLGTPHE